jgi:intracellular sulfur oxidation DsrE/DsrF family protein
MYKQLPNLLLMTFTILFCSVTIAEQDAPYGKASVENIDYAPQKVLYDVSTSNMDSFVNVLDRVSYLNTLYGADPFRESIVLVLHGDEIPYFAIANYDKYKDLMQRADSLTKSGPIEFRMCRVAAKGHGLEPDEINGFVKVVPMADAEIIRLQQEDDYAYMH